MGLRCCACGFTKKNNVSLFIVPRDRAVRELWNKILNHPDKTLKQNDYLCENHFASTDVKKFLMINDVKIPNKQVRLRKGCLPIPYITKIDLDIHIKQEPDLDIKDEPEWIDTESSICSPEIEDVNQFQSEETTCFFDDIYNSQNFFGLTEGLTEYWGIHSCVPDKTKVRACMVLLAETKKRSILFSQMDIHQDVPVLGKQVILKENLELNYFIRQSPIQHPNLPKLCGSIEELLAAINEFSKFRLCRGGPHCREYTEMLFITNSAYKDYSSMTWRHKYCDNIAVEGFETCAHCSSLSKYLKVTQKNSKTLKWLKYKFGPDVEKWKRTLTIVKKQ